MAVRPPKIAHRPSHAERAYDVLGDEIMEEKADALGRAGEKVEATLARLRATDRDDEDRERRLRDAARAVHAYLIQRELCGLRRHDDVIREHGIPREVLVRLGAS